MGDVMRYVVTISIHDETLTDINELNNHLTRAGFTVTLMDDAGKVHDLGTNSYGLITPQSPADVEALASGLAESATGQQPKVDIVTFETWLNNLASA